MYYYINRYLYIKEEKCYTTWETEFRWIASTNKAVEADDTYNALSEDSADNTLTDLDVSSAMDINIVGDNDINMLDSLDDFDNLDSDEINSSEE